MTTALFSVRQTRRGDFAVYAPLNSSHLVSRFDSLESASSHANALDQLRAAKEREEQGARARRADFRAQMFAAHTSLAWHLEWQEFRHLCEKSVDFEANHVSMVEVICAEIGARCGEKTPRNVVNYFAVQGALHAASEADFALKTALSACDEAAYLQAVAQCKNLMSGAIQSPPLSEIWRKRVEDNPHLRVNEWYEEDAAA